MQKGRIVEYGSHSELYSQQQSLYHTLMRGHEASSTASAAAAGSEITPAVARVGDRSAKKPGERQKPTGAGVAVRAATLLTGPTAVSGMDEAVASPAAGPDRSGLVRNGYAAPAPAEVNIVGPTAAAMPPWRSPLQPAAAAAASPPAAAEPAAASAAVTVRAPTTGGDRSSDSSRLRLGGHMGVLGPGMHRARRALRMQLALGQYSAHGGSDVLEMEARRPAILWWAKQRIMGSGNLLCGAWPLPQDNSQRSECVLSSGLMPRMLRVDDPGHLVRPASPNGPGRGFCHAFLTFRTSMSQSPHHLHPISQIGQVWPSVVRRGQPQNLTECCVLDTASRTLHHAHMCCRATGATLKPPVRKQLNVGMHVAHLRRVRCLCAVITAMRRPPRRSYAAPDTANSPPNNRPPNPDASC